jgi:O-acetylserine/cysteine efflux transporter
MLIWGANFVAIKIGVDGVPPLFLTALRFLFTAVPAVLFIARPKVSWSALAAFGLLLGLVKFGLVFTAMKLGMPAGLTSLVMQMQVFFTIGLGFVLMHERPGGMQMLGALIAFGGIGVFMAERMGAAAPLGPFLMLLGAAFAWGCANIVVKKAAERRAGETRSEPVNMLAFVVWSSLFSPPPLIALSLMVEGPSAILASISPPRLDAMLALAFIVGPSTLFTFAMWNSLLQRYPTAVVAPFALLVPVFGILAGVIAFGEPFTVPAMIGSAIVFAGLIVNVFGERLVKRLRGGPVPGQI